MGEDDPVDEDDGEDDEGGSSVPVPRPSGRKTSWAWNFYIRDPVQMATGQCKAICRLCKDAGVNPPPEYTWKKGNLHYNYLLILIIYYY